MTESVLQYGCTTWSLTKCIEKKLDRNKSLRQHSTKRQLYGLLPLISKTIQLRGTRYTGHWVVSLYPVYIYIYIYICVCVCVCVCVCLYNVRFGTKWFYSMEPLLRRDSCVALARYTWSDWQFPFWDTSGTKRITQPSVCARACVCVCYFKIPPELLFFLYNAAI